MRKERNILGIGMMLEVFHSLGKRPEEIERLKMWERGREIEKAAAFKRKEDISSGPGAVLDGRLEMRERMVSSVQRSDSGRGR